MYFLYKKTPFRVSSFGGLLRTCLQHENPSRPPHKKTPFRVSSFGGLPRTCLQHENPPPSTIQKKHPFGCLLLVDYSERVYNTRIPPVHHTKKHPFGCLLLVDSQERVYNTRIHPRPLYKKNTLSGVFFWWTPKNVFTTRESSPVHYTKKHPFGCVLLVDGDGFEPSKAVPADLQSDPFGRSGTRPGAGDWSRTNNLLITNQLLCH